jgi:hypothetical protein
MLFNGSRAKATPENTKTSITLIRHPMGMTMQHPWPWLLPLPQRIIRPSSASYPESANKRRLTTTVRVTLNTTLTSNQNRHPLPTL